MADLSLTFTIDENQEISPDFLEDLVERTRLSNVDHASLASGLVFPRLSAPGSPAQGDAVVNASTGRLDFYDSGPTLQSLGLAETISVTNQSGITLVTGDVVVVDPANSFSCTVTHSNTSNVSPNVLGPVTEVQGPGNSVAVAVRGFAICRVFALVAKPVGSWIAAPPSNVTTRRGTVETSAEVVAGSGSPGSTYFGIAMEDAAQLESLIWALIWR